MCAPSVRVVVESQFQAPDAVTTAVQTIWPSIRASTVVPGVPVPDTVGVLSAVSEPSAGVTTTGPVAAPTVNVLVFEGCDTLPARSVAVALTLCEPAASGVVTSMV